MWYIKNLRLAQAGTGVTQTVGQNIEAPKSLAHQMLTKDYNTLKKAIPNIGNYAEIPLENKLWIQIDKQDKKSIFEGTLSEIIKQVLDDEKYKSRVKDSSPKQEFNPEMLISSQPQQPVQTQQANGKKNINPLLVSPYGNKKMPGYAIIGTKEKAPQEAENNDLQDKKFLLDRHDKKYGDESSDFSEYIKIPESMFGIYIYGADQVSINIIKNKLNEFSSIKNFLVDNVYRPEGVNSSYIFEYKDELDKFEYNYNKSESTFQNNAIKELYEKEQYDILTVYFNILNSFGGDFNIKKLGIIDERANSYNIVNYLLPPYKPTYFPIRVESAIYTYSDKLPVDIYLNNKLIRKGFPNNSYFKLDPKEFQLSKGPHELKILDNRPGIPQNIVQSRIQRFEFRLEPEKEAIVFNVEPNRVIR